MAQAGYTPIQLYYSTTPTNTPSAGNLVDGELAINTADGKLFYKDSGGSVQIIASTAGTAGTVQSVSVVSANGFAGTVGNPSTTPAITLTTTVTGLLKGNGTAISAAVSGTDYAPATSGTSILYGDGAGGFSSVTIGSGISFAGGTLSATGSGGTVTSITAGTGLSGGTITTSGTIAIDSTVVTLTGTQTLTNKRITQRSLALTSTSGAITPDSDLYDQVNYSLTGSSSFSNPSGTPTNGQKLSIRLYAASTQTISSWSSSSGGYRAIGTTLPTSVPTGKTIYVGCVYNSTDLFWDVVAVATQA